MSEIKHKEDPYIGIRIGDYTLTEKIGEGKIGKVYKAERNNPYDVLACKVIPEENLKGGWEIEPEKVMKLRKVDNVVQYHAHDTKLDKNSRPFVWILWDYIDGNNLRKYLESSPSWLLDLAFIESIVIIVLNVFYACRVAGISHGDLHEGNILISNPDSLVPGNPRRIWISDFGCGGSHNELEPRDDYRQLFSIISNLLGKLDQSKLTPRDKAMYPKIKDFFAKKFLEVDSTQRHYINDPELLLQNFNELRLAAERESARGTRGDKIKGPGDYLWAEALGLRSDEWSNLFVPEFLAAQDLLSKNITVLTGARGCGKTMSFRRLTAFMDKIIKEPSGVKGADQFVGFYLNCRELIEAFPWLPKQLEEGIQQQIIHYFHLAWFSEICKTLAISEVYRFGKFEWLDGFLTGIYGERYHSLPQGADVIVHVQAFLENEKERCRMSDIGKIKGLQSWPLARFDFLDRIQSQLESHVSWIGDKPLYFFLDDYTIPTIPREAQRILNNIIFKRRSKLFFKISTESSNSFEMKVLSGKPLERHHDFDLIDLATENIHQSAKEKREFLGKIFKPRIERHPPLKGKDLTLNDILGKMPMSNNDLAWRMRDAVEKEGHRKTILYHGVEAFVGMWASDIRIMIQIFTDMLREANGKLKKGIFIIDESIQNKCYIAAGGESLCRTESVNDPSFWEKGPSSTRSEEPYGMHLKDIVEAFGKVSKFELTKGKLVKNEGRLNPKQAFRLEILDKFDLSEEASRYYEGLLRWHIFLEDRRGKSVRGMFTPRLYLHRVLIPYFKLTFSSHDNIQLRNTEFVDLLVNPKNFFKYWEDKRKKEKKKEKNKDQMSLFDLIEKDDKT